MRGTALGLYMIQKRANKEGNPAGEFRIYPHIDLLLQHTNSECQLVHYENRTFALTLFLQAKKNSGKKAYDLSRFCDVSRNR